MNLANSDLWADPTREVGYPLFLRLVGHVMASPNACWSRMIPDTTKT